MPRKQAKAKRTGKRAAPALRKQPHGGALQTGNPANKGGGRKPDFWKAACRELASSAEVLERAAAILANPDHPDWLATWKFVAEQGYGKATQAVNVGSEGALFVHFIEVPEKAKDSAEWSKRYTPAKQEAA